MKRTNLNQVSERRSILNRKRRSFVRKLLDERLFCEARIDGCTMMPTDVHEIRTRARGGSIVQESNCLALCRSCHDFITREPAWSAENGFVLHSWSSGADERAAERARNSFTYGLDDGDDD